METLDELTQAIMSDEQNIAFTEQGIKPLFSIPKRLGLISWDKLLVFVPKSPAFTGMILVVIISEIGWEFHAKNSMNLVCLLLYQWIFISQVMVNQVIYLLAKDLQISGMKVLALAPDIQLTILVGNYAQHYYLHQKSSAKLTDTVKHYKDYLPEFFPLVHPSPRNNIWQAKIHGLWKK